MFGVHPDIPSNPTTNAFAALVVIDTDAVFPVPPSPADTSIGSLLAAPVTRIAVATIWDSTLNVTSTLAPSDPVASFQNTVVTAPRAQTGDSASPGGCADGSNRRSRLQAWQVALGMVRA